MRNRFALPDTHVIHTLLRQTGVFMNGLFETYVTGKNAHAYHSRCINAHLRDVRAYFPETFDGKLFATFVQNAQKAAEKVLEQNGVTDDMLDKPFSQLPKNARKTRDAFYQAVETEIQYAHRHFNPPT
ncbi:MAG: hypothetical protein AAFY81_09015, partial [Pseudomonadota bacterium]